MSTIGYDKLLEVTDSRYRLSVIVAKRAVQLRKGIPSTLSPEEYPKHHDVATKDVISIAMREVLLAKQIVWAKDLPSDAELLSANSHRLKPVDQARYSATPDEFSDDSHFDDDERTIAPTFAGGRPRIDRRPIKSNLGF